ncbi:MAG: Crp/Fnr family transcriptional regulator [Ignavibacteria bacterium]|nr:Crp/Fnr family transcriptional regulator [Ignavibacteria bacterium]
MPGKSKLWYLENFNLFEGLSQEKMMELDKKLSMSNVDKNEIIYFADEPSNSIFLLKEGNVKLARVSDDGKEAITAILKPGEIFGELAITGGSSRDDTAIALDKAVICTISKENFENLLIENPKFNLRITKLIGMKLQRVARNLENLTFKDSSTRVIEFLTGYAEEYGKKIGDEIFIKTTLTHQDIANLTATSRQTVTTVMNNLKDKKIIEFSRNKIIIKNPEKLRTIK